MRTQLQPNDCESSKRHATQGAGLLHHTAESVVRSPVWATRFIRGARIHSNLRWCPGKPDLDSEQGSALSLRCWIVTAMNKAGTSSLQVRLRSTDRHHPETQVRPRCSSACCMTGASTRFTFAALVTVCADTGIGRHHAGVEAGQ